MAKAFCPGHITCFFRPAGAAEADLLLRGSVGAGIRISSGAWVEVTERSDRKLKITLDSVDCSAPVTESVFRQLEPDRGFDIVIENDLPCGEGFGMSAAGAVAAALCLTGCEDDARQKAFEVAHRAEIEGGGGLGDVSALYCLAHQPVRVKEGLPPAGNVIGTDIVLGDLTLAVLGPKMHTGNVLSDPKNFNAISKAGQSAMAEYLKGPSERSLYAVSNVFSSCADIESKAVSRALGFLRSEGYSAGMCMLGNSIFTDAPEDVLRHLLGEDVAIYSCSSTDADAFIQKE